MNKCAVRGCKNKRDKDLVIVFHKFPKQSSVRAAWVSRCGRVDVFNPESSHICSEHFTREDYEQSLRGETPHKKTLKKTAVPSLKCHINDIVDSDDSIFEDSPLEDSDEVAPDKIKSELKDMKSKLTQLCLEYEVLKSKSKDQEERIRDLQKENTLLKRKLFAKS